MATVICFELYIKLTLFLATKLPTTDWYSLFVYLHIENWRLLYSL